MRSKLNLFAAAGALAAVLALGGMPLVAAPPEPAPAMLVQHKKHKKHHKKSHSKHNKKSQKHSTHRL